MKRISVLLIGFTLTLLSLSEATASSARRATASYWVSIHCSSCQERLVESLKFEKGVRDISVTVDAKRVDITYDTRRTDAVQLGRAIERLGYEVRDYSAAEETTAGATPGQGCCSRGGEGHTCTGKKPDGSACCSGGGSGERKCCKDKGVEHKCGGARESGQSGCSGHSTGAPQQPQHNCGQGAR
jgi:periplasmic mercuric ion binding protein